MADNGTKFLLRASGSAGTFADAGRFLGAGESFAAGEMRNRLFSSSGESLRGKMAWR